MSITTKWEINTLEKNVADGYVKKAIYRVIGLDGSEEKARETGEVELERPDTLIPYKSLTEATVLGWVKTKLGTDAVASIEKSLKDKIELINTPVTSIGKPW